MWEAIESNRRRSWILLSLMGVMLILMGFAIGFALHPQGGIIGILVGLGLWGILWIGAVTGGDRMLLFSAKARPIEKQDAPMLWNVVEEMTIASGLGTMPKIYLINDSVPNAFAMGRKPEKFTVAVTSGLLRKLNRDELQGVIAHEIGHLANRDTSFMMLAGVMLGAIVLMAHIFFRIVIYGGDRSRSSNRSGGGQAQAIILVLALVLVIVAPICAELLYLACSRRREYLADASSARYTRYPAGLASALEKISRGQLHKRKDVNKVIAPMYIVNPLESFAGTLFAKTHPPIQKRIQILRSMAGGAGFMEYENAYKKVSGGDTCIGNRTLQSDKGVSIREAFKEPATKQSAQDRAHDVLDLVGRLEGLLLLTCACGVGIKLPPHFKRNVIQCPRCGKGNKVPKAESQSKQDDASATAEPVEYKRNGRGWESFQCSCGAAVQLSPSFSAPKVRCNSCHCEIKIV